MKNILSQVVGVLTTYETALVGILVSLIVLVAGDLHVVLNKPNVTSVLAPLVAGLLAELRAKTKAKPTSVPAPAAK